MNMTEKSSFRVVADKLSEVIQTLTSIQKACLSLQPFQEEIKIERGFGEEVDIKRIGDEMEAVDDMIRRRSAILSKADSISGVLKETNSIVQIYLDECKCENNHLISQHNELTRKMIELEEDKLKKDVKDRQEWIDERTEQFEKRKNELERGLYAITQNESHVKLGEDIQNCLITQIETWSTKKVNGVLFDSKVDTYTAEKNMFGSALVGKGKMAIIIEDMNANLFGVYLETKVFRSNRYVCDRKAFIFSLFSNGRSERPLKFDIKEPQYAFVLNDDEGGRLFSVGYGCLNGNDIDVDKKNCGSGKCGSASYDYKGNVNILCGSNNFLPKRIVVLEMS
ncbi:hypothetical protein EIN_284870 [Entamoeba invadens IP1]|uniref:TLDc domain-containing protein n=1 Tax=Entamoeba invadens IP1 TaxID=370355 RepID=L7FJV6_ENTIV|nr:hypothetical protein EIN_284870 [Entamoeba invadens IP1]ELP84901.1 hypothetical protein EIN_284870 [Entamoeba invadens IP1]|eukprot:XP_004184247.1 hypothetical protein EIN_284870 [Entamoeba invadens IP1]